MTKKNRDRRKKLRADKRWLLENARFIWLQQRDKINKEFMQSAIFGRQVLPAAYPPAHSQ